MERVSVCGLLLLIVATQSFIADACSEYGDVQLINGSSFTGLVEICIYSEWRVITVDNTYDWDDGEAQVVCRQLGLEHTGVAVSYVNIATGGIYLDPDHSHCNGSEQELVNCTSFDEFLFRYGIYGYYAAGVCCLPDEEFKPTSVSVSTLSSTSLNVSWSAQENNCFNYQISCFSGSSGIVSTAGPTSRSADITGAQPSTTYQCCVRATSTTILGPETCANATTDRRVPPQGLYGVAQSSTSIYLRWSPPPSDDDIIGYDVRIVEVDTTMKEIKINTLQTSITVQDLSPFHNYHCSVAAQASIGTGPYTQISLRTQESTPVAPSFSAVRQNATVIHIDVEPLTSLEERRGNILFYNVIWKIKKGHQNCNDFSNPNITSSPQPSLTIENVDPRLEYSVTVSADTAAGRGDYGTARVVELYLNSPFKILFGIRAPQSCEYFIQHLYISVVDKDTVEFTISSVLSERCECSFPQQYIADGQFMCVSDDPNSVVYEGRLISTDDTDSVELLFHLQEWLLTEPTVSLSGVDLQATENCRVYIKELGNNTDYDTQCDWFPNKVKECRNQHRVTLIGVGAGGFLLLLLLLAVIAILTICLCKKRNWSLIIKKKAKDQLPPAKNEYQCRGEYESQTNALAHSVELMELNKTTINSDDQAADFYVPTSDEEEEEEEEEKRKERYQESKFSGPGNLLPIPPRCLVAEENVESGEEEEEEEEEGKKEEEEKESEFGSPPPIPPRCFEEEDVESAVETITGGVVTGGVVTFQVDMELHNMLQNIAELQDDTSEDENRENSKESSDEIPGVTIVENKMATSINVDWNTHLFLQSLQTEDEESPLPGKEQSDKENEESNSKCPATDKGKATSLSVDWDTHLLLQSLQAADAEPPVTTVTESKSLETCDDGDYEKVNPDCARSSGDNIYQPLVPRRAIEKSEEENSYQQLIDWQ